MIATAADYAWFAGRPAGLSEAYCLTFARGLSTADFLGRLGARPEAVRTGIQSLSALSMDLWSGDTGGSSLLIGVTPVPGNAGAWALGVEVNGFLGATESVIVPLSAGTTVVSVYRNFNAGNRFYWVEDGGIQLDFEPAEPGYRDGSAPDTLLDVMRQVGFEFGEDGMPERSDEAALALAAYVTGVRLTPELLEQATYQCGVAPGPS